MRAGHAAPMTLLDLFTRRPAAATTTEPDDKRAEREAAERAERERAERERLRALVREELDAALDEDAADGADKATP